DHPRGKYRCPTATTDVTTPRFYAAGRTLGTEKRRMCGSAAHSTRFPGVLAADVRHLDLALADRRVDGVLGAELRVAVAADAPDLGQPGGDLLVAGAVADQRAQVVAADREEAGVELALGREPRAGAVGAERLRARWDDAALA